MDDFHLNYFSCIFFPHMLVSHLNYSLFSCRELHSPVSIGQRTRLKTFQISCVLPITEPNFSSPLLCFLFRSLRTSFHPFVTLISYFSLRLIQQFWCLSLPDEAKVVKLVDELGIGRTTVELDCKSMIDGFHCYIFYHSEFNILLQKCKDHLILY